MMQWAWGWWWCWCWPVMQSLWLGCHTLTSAKRMDTLGIEPRASRMLSGCDTTTPRALGHIARACNDGRRNLAGPGGKSPRRKCGCSVLDIVLAAWVRPRSGGAKWPLTCRGPSCGHLDTCKSRTPGLGGICARRESNPGHKHGRLV